MRRFFTTITIMLTIVAIALLADSCAMKRHVEDNSVIDKNEGVRSDYIKFEDNLTLTIKESHQSESEKIRTIMFGECGGTYNTKTGDATGVASISESEKESVLSAKDSVIESLNALVRAKSDSIANLKQKNDVKEKVEVDVMQWWMWLLIGVFVGMIVLIILKKHPVTKPFMIWL